jgi:hypothetical protein
LEAELIARFWKVNCHVSLFMFFHQSIHNAARCAKSFFSNPQTFWVFFDDLRESTFLNVFERGSRNSLQNHFSLFRAKPK